MKIVIAGGTGFIGQALVKHYHTVHAQCVIIGRSRDKIKRIFSDSVIAIQHEQLNDQGLQAIKTADLVINLAGENISEKRWTPLRKQQLLDSRLVPTQRIAALCATLGKNSPPLFNASAIGIYGLQSTLSTGLPPALDEQTVLDFNNSPDFPAKIARAWEMATQSAKNAGVRVVNMRFGVVLGKNGGALKQLKLPFLFFMGGPIGNGQQPFSWIAMPDLVRAIDFVYAHPDISGPVNFVSPQAVTQKQLAQAFGKMLHRPSIMPTPAFALKMVFGEMAEELLLRGQHVYPNLLLKQGFQFQYPTIESALATTL